MLITLTSSGGSCFCPGRVKTFFSLFSSFTVFVVVFVVVLIVVTVTFLTNFPELGETPPYTRHQSPQWDTLKSSCSKTTGYWYQKDSFSITTGNYTIKDTRARAVQMVNNHSREY
jgi:hypothetical protein